MTCGLSDYKTDKMCTTNSPVEDAGKKVMMNAITKGGVLPGRGTMCGLIHLQSNRGETYKDAEEDGRIQEKGDRTEVIGEYAVS